MKNVTYLLVLMFSLVLTSASCDKNDDPIVPDPIDNGFISLDELIGTWYSVSYVYNGVEYKSNTAPADIEPLFYTFTFTSTTVQKIGFTTGYDFKLTGNDLIFTKMREIKEEYVVTKYSQDTLYLDLKYKLGYPDLKYGTYKLIK